MVKKIFTFFAGIAFLCLIGGVVYADTNGLFAQDNEAAMQLVEKYIATVMKNYMPDENKVSFRGIIKQGCDFWYYNDYNNKTIAVNHRSGSENEVEATDYSIECESVEFANRAYTITAKVTETVYYKNFVDPVTVTRTHIISIEQNGSEMLIIDDKITPKQDLSSILPFANGANMTSDTPSK